MSTYFRGEPSEVLALGTYVKLMRCATSVQAHLERRLLGFGLTDSQFGVLEALLHLGPSPQHELGRALFTSRANVTTVVDNLEKRWLVRRERSTVDRRLVIVHLTDDGRDLIDRIFPGQVQEIVTTFAALDPADQEHLGRLCKQLGTSVAPVSASKRAT